jgi:hypothetical protein
MKWPRTMILVGVCLLAPGLALSVVMAGLALAEGSAAIDWWVFQPIIGPSSADAVSLGAGYWYGGGEPTAVTLAGFKARPVGGNILVEWETATEIDTLGFDLYRSESPGGPHAKLNASLIPVQVPGAPIGAAYAWPDEAVEPGLTYWYWLDDIDVDSVATRHGPVEATALYANYLPLVHTDG